MIYNVFLLPKIQIGKLKNRPPNRISALLKDHWEKAMVITLNDNFTGGFFYPKTLFVKRGTECDHSILNRIEKGVFTLVVLYDCFFEYSGSFLSDIIRLNETKENLLLINVLPLVSAVVSKELFKGELAERIDYPDWERDDLHICRPFQSKICLYEETQLLSATPTEEKTFSLTKKELYKKEFHFYRLLKSNLCCSTDMDVFHLFLNELSLELQQGGVLVNPALFDPLLQWINITHSFRFQTQQKVDDEYLEKIRRYVREIIQTNSHLIDKISDFFDGYNRT